MKNQWEQSKFVMRVLESTNPTAKDKADAWNYVKDFRQSCHEEQKYRAENESLHREVAVLHKALDYAVTVFGNRGIGAPAFMHEALSTTQATAEAWEREVKVKALEGAAEKFGDPVIKRNLRTMAAELRNQQEGKE